MSAIDYLRFTSRSFDSYLRWNEALTAAFPGARKEAKVMQYTGLKGTTVPYFTGKADINNRRHFMMQISGSAASELWPLFTPDPQLDRCTRIDLQRTIPYDGDPKPSEIYDLIPPSVYHSRIIGSDGTWTVYIGKRTSDRMVRIYVKLLDRPYLRVEYELKGDLATTVADNLKIGSLVIDDAFEGLMSKNPARNVLGRFMGTGAAAATVAAAKRGPSYEGRIRWIESTATALDRYMNDHDLRPHVEMMIRSLAARLDE